MAMSPNPAQHFEDEDEDTYVDDDRLLLEELLNSFLRILLPTFAGRGGGEGEGLGEGGGASSGIGTNVTH